MAPGDRSEARSSRGTQRLLGLLLAFAAVAAYVVWSSSAASTARIARATERHPQSSWVACNQNAHNRQASTFTPLRDRRAAALVTREPENRRYNGRAYTLDGRHYAATNSYVPSSAEIRTFRRARNSGGQTATQFNPYFAYVDGHDGMRHPSTDDLIQWAAHKWGIPENWLRAEYVQESYWSAFQLGDQASVSARWYGLYPPQARVPHTSEVFQSLGLTQVKWIPDGSVGAGTEPLRWKSTAFNIDYQAATVRFYYDNPRGTRASWGDASYRPCERWNSIGGWFEPYPWGNRGQLSYIAHVRQHLSDQEWTSSSFVHWSPPSFPPGIKFK